VQSPGQGVYVNRRGGDHIIGNKDRIPSLTAANMHDGDLFVPYYWT
jgi:hypothetical protein